MDRQPMDRRKNTGLFLERGKRCCLGRAGGARVGVDGNRCTRRTTGWSTGCRRRRTCGGGARACGGPKKAALKPEEKREISGGLERERGRGLVRVGMDADGATEAFAHPVDSTRLSPVQPRMRSTKAAVGGCGGRLVRKNDQIKIAISCDSSSTAC